MIRVVEPGLSTTVQDTGRFGHYHIGMPPSGAMDQYAHKVANYVVGNDETAATLEMTYAGPDLEFEEDAVIAATGADMEPTIDGEEIPTWTAVRVEAGDVLSFEFATEGVRSYLAVAGGIDVPTVMESRSTYTLIGIGGHEGRALEEGDRLPVGDADGSATVGAAVDTARVPDYADTDTIRVVMGLCDYRLTDEGREQLLGTEWKISDEADRVGCRLTGGPDIHEMFEKREQPFGAGPDPTNVVDLGYPVGSIQMAGQPIILMRDAVTGGGYATVGTVVSVDRNLLAQARTHRNIRFEAIDEEEALEARSAHDDRLDAIRANFLD